MNTNKFHNEVIVSKNCGRTNGSDTLDGTASVTGVQVWTSTDDAGAAATTYYGQGETVITDTSGLVLTAATALKAIPAISFRHRSYDGKNKFAGLEFAGKNIDSFEVTKYKADSEQITQISGVDASLADTVYSITFEVKESPHRQAVQNPLRRSASFRTAVAGNTAAEIVAGLAADITLQFDNESDSDFNIKAWVGAGDELLIQALPNKWDGIRFLHYKTLFLTTIDFDATVADNVAADQTFDSILYSQATAGAGLYKQVYEAEFFNKTHYGMNENFYGNVLTQNNVNMDAQEFENDGVTANRYDTVVINASYTNSGSTGGTIQSRSMELYLPVDDNGTNQQKDIIDILNKYIVTEWGVGAAIVLS